MAEVALAGEATRRASTTSTRRATRPQTRRLSIDVTRRVWPLATWDGHAL